MNTRNFQSLRADRPVHPADREVLEARLGGAVAAALNARAAVLQHDVSERLRASREQAMARARFRPAEASSAVAIAGGNAGGTAVLGRGTGPGSIWPWKLASVLPLVVLLAGLVFIERWNNDQQVHAAAEIDAMLLADELPPAAYADPGFGEFLRSPRSTQP